MQRATEPDHTRGNGAMERTPDGRLGVRFEMRDDDIPVIAAALTPAIHAQRGIFFGREGRLPDEEELRVLQNGVLNDWLRMVDRLQEHQRELRG
jgi:hypothetical protein